MPIAAFAQINVQQNNLPAQQAPLFSDDCYTQNLDNGNAALLRNERKAALSFFLAAKQCPEARNNARRQADLDARISRCQEVASPPPAARAEKQSTEGLAKESAKRTRPLLAETSNARKPFPANRQLLNDTLDDCFHRMEAEADRAFRLRYWEDAAALYRAAKNCSNADQESRQKMSQRILACRNAAENELFSKQQEAERQARHAIASKLADDAEKLLRYEDRTLAFRLADFANHYIAPDDNPNCVQAMLDAWYYQPSERSKHREDELYRPAFCYELSDKLGENIQIKFEKKRGGKHWLWAFLPQTGDFTVWEFPEMKVVQNINLGENSGVQRFDISPSGALLLKGSNFLEIRKGGQNHRVQVSRATYWCFSERGDELFYENPAEKAIYLLPLAELEFKNTKKGAKSNELARLTAVERPFVTGVASGLLALSHSGGKFWLGYPDRIEVLAKPEFGKPWKREAVIRFDGIAMPTNVDAEAAHMSLYPQNGFAVLAFGNKMLLVDFTDPNNVKTTAYEDLQPLALLPGQNLAACLDNRSYEYQGFFIFNVLKGDTLTRQKFPNFYGYNLFSGSFSSDGRWVAAVNSSGNVKVWALHDATTLSKYSAQATDEHTPRFSPSGAHLWLQRNDSLWVYRTDDFSTPLFAAPANSVPLRGVSDQWSLRAASPGKLEARKLGGGKALTLPLATSEGLPILFSFDVKENKYVAYQSDWNTVEVRSLQNGELVDKKTFEGGYVGDLRFTPYDDALLVVHTNPLGEAATGQSSVKLWWPSKPKEKARALRLHNYAVQSLAVAPYDTLAAFSNGTDIRVFHLKSPDNELVRIRPLNTETLRCLAFRPNSRQLAAAYDRGSVIFWDMKTGQPAFALKVKDQSSSTLLDLGWDIAALGFSADGSVLYLYENDGTVMQYVVDPTQIRDAAQDEHRALQSFEAAHIANYNLESAMAYPGNFERLAESGDAPLIRSFFQYYRWQAVESNNIAQVKAYCDRAAYLYERLDPNTQAFWLPDVRFIYEDYAHKLILRSQLKPAEDVIALMQRKFSAKPALLVANLALLKREYKKAAAHYSKYLLNNEYDGLPTGLDAEWKISQSDNAISQLLDFELLDSAQLTCYCSVLALSGVSSNICGEAKKPIYRNAYLSELDNASWEIFRLFNNRSYRLAPALENLKEAYQKSNALAQRSPETGNPWRDKVLLELGGHCYQFAKFERSRPEAEQYYKEGAEAIINHGPLKTLPDTMRLSLLTSIYLAWGNHLLEADQVERALEQYSNAIEASQQLYAAAVADTLQLYQYGEKLFGNICLGAGHAYLLSGKPAEARHMYNQAANYFVTYGLNTLYQANVAVYEGNEEQAMLDYGGIFNAAQSAEAMFMLDRLSKRFPDPRIPAFIPKLRSGLRSKNLRLAGTETEFLFGQLKVEHFAALAQWDSAAVWSERCLQTAETAKSQANADPEWAQRWLDEHINLSYYLLLSRWRDPKSLATCVQLVEKAERYLDENPNLYYRNRILLTLNRAHALLIRNRPGDREAAMGIYQQFLQSYTTLGDTRDVLEKDWRDLRRVGAPIPEHLELDKNDIEK